jgi:hypothetical protein
MGLLSNNILPALFISPLKNVEIICGMGVLTGQPVLHNGFLQFKHLFASAITLCAMIFSLYNSKIKA